MGLSDHSLVEQVRDIIVALHPAPLVNISGLKLGRWMSDYYRCTLFDAISLMLPPGFRRRVRVYFELGTKHVGGESDVSPRIKVILEYVKKHGRISEAQLKGFAGGISDRELTSLVRRGLIRRVWELTRSKVAPIYQNFDPQDATHLPLFKKAEELDIPVIWHQGTSFVRPGPLKYANPIMLEDIAVACPNLRMIIAHMGHPWETECMVLIRKHPHLYADISALHYRPLRHYQAFMTALEYGVEHKLIFGSDFPSATPEQVITGQGKVNDVVKGTNFPKFPEEAIHNIIYENWRQFIQLY